MRTLSPELLAELALPVTAPGYLVRIAFAIPVYLSTLGDIEWDGNTWLAADVRVAGLSIGERPGQRARLSIGNADRVMGALVLGEGVAERAIDIWAVWSGVVEPIHLFSGVGDEAQVAERVDIALVGEHQRTAFLPRRFINAASGFRTLLPAGTVVRIGQQTIRLERQ